MFSFLRSKADSKHMRICKKEAADQPHPLQQTHGLGDTAQTGNSRVGAMSSVEGRLPHSRRHH